MPETTATVSPADAEQPERVELSQSQYDELQTALKRWQTQDRPALAQRVQRAQLFLDPKLAPDAAAVAQYDLDHLDKQIEQLADQLAHAVVIKPPTDAKTVQVGTLVTVRYEDDAEETLALVGPWEAGGSNAAVASTSALGQALLGKRPGDRVTAHADKDSITVQITDVTLPAAAVDTEQVGAE